MSLVQKTTSSLRRRLALIVSSLFSAHVIYIITYIYHYYYYSTLYSQRWRAVSGYSGYVPTPFACIYTIQYIYICIVIAIRERAVITLIKKVLKIGEKKTKRSHAYIYCRGAHVTIVCVYTIYKPLYYIYIYYMYSVVVFNGRSCSGVHIFF